MPIKVKFSIYISLFGKMDIHHQKKKKLTRPLDESISCAWMNITLTTQCLNSNQTTIENHLTIFDFLITLTIIYIYPCVYGSKQLVNLQIKTYERKKNPFIWSSSSWDQFNIENEMYRILFEMKILPTRDNLVVMVMLDDMVVVLSILLIKLVGQNYYWENSQTAILCFLQCGPYRGTNYNYVYIHTMALVDFKCLATIISFSVCMCVCVTSVNNNYN